ncbi:armadillo repeat-containing protein 10-like isoform X2 [Petaurus breviceps papuanus]|uniref:armadillo repeat-containing protein 10-like isoform X2 n=1 Tax=Petaurus breviceps papuanus TaxID=3040969 RepID=UPI0036D83783
MGRAQEAGWVAGLVLGAGACYCVYRLTWGKEKSRKTAAAGGSRGCPAVPGRTLPQRGSGLQVTSSPSPPAENDCTKSSGILDAQHLKKLICLLQSTEDALIRERALITLGNSAAFSVNQVHLSQICEETLSSPLNSDVQLAGLRLLTNMTVTNDYQHLIANSISGLFDLLCVGNENTKIQTLKVLLNLSANPAMTKELLNVQVSSSLISLFDGNVEREILLRVLTLFANLKDSIKQKENAFVQHSFNNTSLFSLLYGESTECTEKLLALACHHDVNVKEKVAKILTIL